MGYFSESNLEEQFKAQGIAFRDVTPVSGNTPAAPAAQAAQAPFASPYMSSAFTSVPPTIAPPQPAPNPVAPPVSMQQPVAPAAVQVSAATPTTAPAAVQTPVAAPTAAPAAVQSSVAATATTPATPVPTQQTVSPSSAPKVEKPEDAKNGDKEVTSADDDDKRKAHEEAEAKRKAEHEAKFAARRAQEQSERDRVAGLSDDAVMAEAMKRVSDGFERLTRRNMKDCVSEYIQTMCLSDPAFARRAMEPVKNMTNCVKYINNKAREYVKKEMEDNDTKPDQGGIYGCDVPDDLVYQWAVDYINDPNAKEDEREDEKFTPKPYVGGRSTKSKKKDKDKEKAKKEAEKKAAEKKAAEEKAKQKVDDGQMSLLGAA